MSHSSENAVVEITRLAEPSRNFNFLTIKTLIDPRDEREKIVLSNLVGGGLGTLIFIDAITQEAEVIPLPVDEGAWAVLPIDDQRVVVGTCTGGGYLASLDLASRKWSAPIRDQNTTYIWKCALGSDGMVYCGTYPAGVLLRCDPGCLKLENLGCPSTDSGNRYCRDVYGDVPGFIIVTGGFATAFVAAFEIATGEWTMIAESDGKDHFNIQEITAERIVVEHIGKIIRFDARSFERVEDADAPLTNTVEGKVPFRMAIGPKLTTVLRDGRTVGVRGQEYFIEQSGERVFHRLPVEPAPTTIRSLALDEKGCVWGSCAFGQTIFRYDLSNGAIWNSLAVTEVMGEVYGMVFADGLLFMSCYAGGDHLIYDPAKAWDERGNINPRTLKSLYPKAQRPRAGSVLGPDGGVWTGWSGRYGAYGGALSRIDIRSGEVTSWFDPIPEQQVMGISADAGMIYFTTNTGGEGVPVRSGPGWFCIWHPEHGMVEKYELAGDAAVGKLLSVADVVLVVEGEGLQKFDKPTRRFVSKISLGSPCFQLFDLGNGRVGAACGTTIKIVNVRSDQVEFSVEVPGEAYAGLALPDGDILFQSGTGLYRMKMSEGLSKR